jgi:hypothetical protein
LTAVITNYRPVFDIVLHIIFARFSGKLSSSEVDFLIWFLDQDSSTCLEFFSHMTEPADQMNFGDRIRFLEAITDRSDITTKDSLMKVILFLSCSLTTMERTGTLIKCTHNLMKHLFRTACLFPHRAREIVRLYSIILSLLTADTITEITHWVINAIREHFPESISFATNLILKIEAGADPAWTGYVPHHEDVGNSPLILNIDTTQSILPIELPSNAAVGLLQLCIGVRFHRDPQSIRLLIGPGDDITMDSFSSLSKLNVKSGDTILALINPAGCYFSPLMVVQQLGLQRQLLELLDGSSADSHPLAHMLLNLLPTDPEYLKICEYEHHAITLLTELPDGATRKYIFHVLSRVLSNHPMPQVFEYVWQRIAAGEINEEVLGIVTANGAEEYIILSDELTQVLIGGFVAGPDEIRSLCLKPLIYLLHRFAPTEEILLERKDFLESLLFHDNDISGEFLASIRNAVRLYAILAEMVPRALEIPSRTRALFSALSRIFNDEYDVAPVLAQARHLAADPRFPEVLRFYAQYLKSHPRLAVEYEDLIDPLFDIAFGNPSPVLQQAAFALIKAISAADPQLLNKTTVLFSQQVVESDHWGYTAVESISGNTVLRGLRNLGETCYFNSL